MSYEPSAIYKVLPNYQGGGTLPASIQTLSSNHHPNIFHPVWSSPIHPTLQAKKLRTVRDVSISTTPLLRVSNPDSRNTAFPRWAPRSRPSRALPPHGRRSDCGAPLPGRLMVGKKGAVGRDCRGLSGAVPGCRTPYDTPWPPFIPVYRSPALTLFLMLPTAGDTDYSEKPEKGRESLTT